MATNKRPTPCGWTRGERVTVEKRGTQFLVSQTDQWIPTDSDATIDSGYVAYIRCMSEMELYSWLRWWFA